MSYDELKRHVKNTINFSSVAYDHFCHLQVNYCDQKKLLPDNQHKPT